MDIESAYASHPRFFDAWVGIMEYHTRLMEVRASEFNHSKILGFPLRYLIAKKT